MPSLPVYLSAWMSFWLWAAGEYRMALAGPGGPSFRRARIVWSVGAVAMAVHIGIAFHWVHDWSQASAIEATAQRLRAMMNWGWGGGVVLNEILLAWWWADAAMAWIRGPRWNRPGGYRSFRRAVFWFLWFNGAAVFASGSRRWIGGLLCAGILWIWWKTRTNDETRDAGLP
ncbi:MAG: hypothetical protein JNL10_05390 [Verrucomicrobiales bacterium]|nr:hypothetical protein [Verrucomicrobiales bacterium]